MPNEWFSLFYLKKKAFHLHFASVTGTALNLLLITSCPTTNSSLCQVTSPHSTWQTQDRHWGIQWRIQSKPIYRWWERNTKIVKMKGSTNLNMWKMNSSIDLYHCQIRRHHHQKLSVTCHINIMARACQNFVSCSKTLAHWYTFHHRWNVPGRVQSQQLKFHTNQEKAACFNDSPWADHSLHHKFSEYNL